MLWRFNMIGSAPTRSCASFEGGRGVFAGGLFPDAGAKLTMKQQGQNTQNQAEAM